jgi:acyl-CoA synthetase (AMP-forming)/AMP-acid ligase II
MIGRPASYLPLDIGSGVRTNARRFPDKRAIVQGEDFLTYGQVAARMNRVSNGCQAMGLEPGANAAIAMANRSEYFEIVSGVSATGAAIATVNPMQTEAELASILEDCDARIVFTDAANHERVRAATQAPILVIGDNYESWLSRATATPLTTPPEEWQTFAIPYTSGTTGKPKGVCLPHRSRVLSFFTYASIYGCFGIDDRFLVTTPLFHGGGFAYPMASLFLGGEVELMPAYSPELLFEMCASGVHTGTFVVPTQLNSMFQLPDKQLYRLSGNNFRAMVCNAAPLPEQTKHETLNWFGDGILHETYGSTEAGVVTNLYPSQMRDKANCAGRPITGQSVRLLDDGGNEVPVGEIGELFSQSATVFNGYWNRPEETDASFRDGWFSAGDLARMDEEGFLYIVDRKKDMILSGGVNIYPRDIEEVLYAMPGVIEAAVVGVPDEKWGEAVCAFVRTGPDRPDADAIVAYCRDRMAPHKVPKSVQYVDAIPRNAAGKVLKKDLRVTWKGNP